MVNKLDKNVIDATFGTAVQCRIDGKTGVGFEKGGRGRTSRYSGNLPANQPAPRFSSYSLHSPL